MPTGEYRYADWNQWTVNGLTGRKHITDMDSTAQWADPIFNASIQTMYAAIRVWKRDVNGIETEIGTAGTYKAIASGTPTPTKARISGTWTYPTTAMNPTDCLRVNVYCRLVNSNFTEADLAETLVTEQLGAQSLDTALLYLGIYIQLGTPNYTHLFFFGWYELYGEYFDNFYLYNWCWTPYVAPVRRLTENLSVLRMRLRRRGTYRRPRIRQTIIVRDRVTRVRGRTRKFIENLSVIKDVFGRVVNFRRLLRQNLSAITDVLRTVYTPILVPVRRFTENLSIISDKFSRVATYKRTLRQETIIKDAFQSILSFQRKMIEDLSTLKDAFTRRITYTRRLQQTTVIEDVFRRIIAFPRRFVQNLSILQARFTRRVTYLRRFIQNLSTITDILRRGTQHFRKLTQIILLEVAFTRRIGYIRRQTEVVIIEVRSILRKIKKWLAWLTRRMRLSLEKAKQPPQAEFKV